MPDDEIENLATEIDSGGEVQQGEKRGKEAVVTQDDQPETEDEGADEGPDAVEGEPERKPRASARIAALVEAQKSEKERNDRLERQLEELRTSRNQLQARQESPEEESARLALMAPEERSEYKLNKALRQVAAVTQQSEFRAQEVADKASFDARVSNDPLYEKLAPKVEATLKELRAQGQNVPRQVLFELEVGRAALAARGKTKGQKDKGAANLRRETTAPLNGKGDQALARRRAGDTPASRLKDVQI